MVSFGDVLITDAMKQAPVSTEKTSNEVCVLLSLKYSPAIFVIKVDLVAVKCGTSCANYRTETDRHSGLENNVLCGQTTRPSHWITLKDTEVITTTLTAMKTSTQMTCISYMN